VLELEQKQKIIGSFQAHEKDTGSPEVQIALLSARISYLNGTLQGAQKGPSFPQRAVEDRGAEKALAGLSEEKRYREIQDAYPTPWHTKVMGIKQRNGFDERQVIRR